MAAAISSPVPALLARSGSRSSAATSESPEAAATSTIAVVPSRTSANSASISRPSGSWTLTLRRSPPRASSRTAIVPSPPSAAGQRSGSAPASSTPAPTASATCRAVSVPLNESGATRKRLGVERVDFPLVLVGDHVALHLQRRRQLAALLREVVRQDLELLHLLDARELRVHLIEMLLDDRPHLGVLAQLRRVRRPPLLLAELRALLHVEGDQSDQIGPAVADHDALRDVRALLDLGLEVGRGDVLAARRDDDVLLAAGDREVAVLVELAEVAGVQPAVLERLARGLLVLVVALEDVRPPDQDLAVVGDPDLASRKCSPDLAELEGVGPCDRRRGRRLGHPPPLEHEHPGRVEEAQDLGVDGSGAGDAVLDPPAEQRSDLGQDLLVSELVLLAQEEPDRLSGSFAFADLLADADRPVEDQLLEAPGLLYVARRRRVDLLEDPRHRREVLRLHLDEVGDDLQRVALPVGDVATQVEAEELDQEGEGMGEGEKEVGGRVPVQDALVEGHGHHRAVVAV